MKQEGKKGGPARSDSYAHLPLSLTPHSEGAKLHQTRLLDIGKENAENEEKKRDGKDEEDKDKDLRVDGQDVENVGLVHAVGAL